MRCSSWSFWPFKEAVSDFEELALAAQNLRDLWVVRPGQELWCEIGTRSVVAFGLEPGPPAHDLIQLSLDDGEVGLGLRIAENDKDVASPDVVPLLHPDLAHDAAFAVLHFLGVGFDSDRRGGDHRPIYRRQRTPAADTHKQGEHHGEAQKLIGAQ